MPTVSIRDWDFNCDGFTEVRDCETVARSQCHLSHSFSTRAGAGLLQLTAGRAEGGREHGRACLHTRLADM